MCDENVAKSLSFFGYKASDHFINI